MSTVPANRRKRRQIWWNKQKAMKDQTTDDPNPPKAIPKPQSHTKFHSKVPPRGRVIPSLASRGFRPSTKPQRTKTEIDMSKFNSSSDNDSDIEDHVAPEQDHVTSKQDHVISDDSSSSDDDYETRTAYSVKKETSVTKTDNPKKKSVPITKSDQADKTSKKRYILFLGNLSISSTHEDIVAHFKKRGVVIKELRLLSHKDTGKSRGCAFAEFENDRLFQNALKFHRSKLNGKAMNIEVTCGGGGKSEQRKTKIINKNRRQRIEKAKKS